MPRLDLDLPCLVAPSTTGCVGDGGPVCRWEPTPAMTPFSVTKADGEDLF